MKKTILRFLNKQPVDITIDIFPEEKSYDKTFEANTIGCKCAVCDSCRLIVDGRYKNQCVHYGPYVGYLEIKDDKEEVGIG